MRLPKVKKRRYLDTKLYGKAYLESSRDFVRNNLDTAVWFLENRDKIAEALKATKKADTCPMKKSNISGMKILL
jgi:hypothetical protein